MSDSDIPVRLDEHLCELYSENVSAKLIKVAKRLLKEQNDNLLEYPETVPQIGPQAGKYALRESSFWTCGFFPGSLYSLLERSIVYPQHLRLPPTVSMTSLRAELRAQAHTWAEPLYAQATRTDTHDMAFMINPAFRKDWELSGNKRSLQAVLTAAESLASRYDERVKAIRSWDHIESKRYNYRETDMDKDFLVIIDSMCNLDLLYYAGYHTQNNNLINIANTHAKTVLKSLIREDWSTFHVVNFDPKTGEVKSKFTHQGYKDWSAWSRGQAWAILGFAQSYMWTKDKIFLDAAVSLADYFLHRLDLSTQPYPYVPLWDFDAPVEELPIRDTSAGMIAANGLLILYQAMHGQANSTRFLHAAVRITKETIDLSIPQDKATLADNEDPIFDAILRNATGSANEYSMRRYWDHGLVYADYFFMELGNRFIRMGLV